MTVFKEGDRVLDRRGNAGTVMWAPKPETEVCWVRWDYDHNYLELRGFEELEAIL